MPGPKIERCPGPAPGFFYGYIVVAAALCITVASWGMYYAFGVFFKPVLTEFGWTRAMTSGAFSLAMILQGVTGIAMGGLNDRLGPRIVMTFCGIILGLGYLLMSQIGALWQLYLFYGVIIGIGMSGAVVPLPSTVARWFFTRRSLMTGIVLTGTGIGTLIIPAAANRLISIYDWHVSYIILGTVLLAAVVLAAQFLRRDPARMGQKPYGEQRKTEHIREAEAQGFSLGEAVHTRQLWMSFTMFVCCGFCVFSTMVHIVPHAIDMGISAAGAARILSCIGAATIIGKITLGSAADRIGDRRIFIICFIMVSASALLLVPAREMWLYPFAVIFGFAWSGLAMAQSPLVARLFGLSSHGLIFGFTGVGLTIGGAIGPFFTGYIFDVTGSYQLSFLLCAAVGIAGLVSSVLLRPLRDGGR